MSNEQTASGPQIVEAQAAITSSTTQAVPKQMVRPGQPARHGQPGKPGFQNNRPMRRRIASAKSAVMSPEARRMAEERNQQMVREYLERSQITKCEPRWALGAVPMSLFGTEV